MAEHLGVSPTALSMTLRDPDTPRVSAAKKARILNYVREHTPHLYRVRASRRVVLSMPTINAYSGPIYGAIATGVQSECRRMGWKLDVLMGASAQASDFVGEKLPDGVIAILGRSPFVPLEAVLKFAPVVLVNSRDYGVVCDSVDLNNRAGVKSLLGTLFQSGHRRVVFAYDQPEALAGVRHHLRDRIEAFLGEMVARGLPFQKSDLINAADFGPSRQAPAYDALLQHLLQLVPRPSAVFGFNDAVAAQFIHAVHRAGLSVPGHFAVTGYDDHAVCSETSPTITSFHHDREAMGTMAVQALAYRLEKPDGLRISLSVPGRLVLRESHGKPGSGTSDAR